MSLTLPTPELDKLKEVQEQSQIIGEFLDSCGFVLCRSSNCHDWVPVWEPVPQSIEEILATYFKIDLKKVEQEKQSILRAIRAEVPLR